MKRHLSEAMQMSNRITSSGSFPSDNSLLAMFKRHRAGAIGSRSLAWCMRSCQSGTVNPPGSIQALQEIFSAYRLGSNREQYHGIRRNGSDASRIRDR